MVLNFSCVLTHQYFISWWPRISGHWYPALWAFLFERMSSLLSFLAGLLWLGSDQTAQTHWKLVRVPQSSKYLSSLRTHL